MEHFLQNKCLFSKAIFVLLHKDTGSSGIWKQIIHLGKLFSLAIMLIVGYSFVKALLVKLVCKLGKLESWLSVKVNVFIVIFIIQVSCY